MNTASKNQTRWKVALSASLVFAVLVLSQAGLDSDHPMLIVTLVWLPLAVITWAFGLVSMMNSERQRAYSLFAIVLTLTVIAYFLTILARELHQRDIAENLLKQSPHPIRVFGIVDEIVIFAS